VILSKEGGLMRKLLFFVIGFFLLLNIEMEALHMFEIEHDNDLPISDNFYTSGTSWRYSNIDEKNVLGDKMIWYNFVLGQRIYTPVDITLTISEIEEYERPYAGWLYFGFEREEMFKDKSRIEYEAYMGFVGEYSFAEQSQKTIHVITDSDMPEGWDSQIENILGVQMAVKYYHKNFFREYSGGRSAEGFFTMRGEFGNVFMNLSFSQIFKYGKINEFPFLDSWEEGSLYIFVEPKLDIVLYDATLEGDIFKNQSIYTEDINNIVGELQAGIEMRMGKIKLNYSINIGSSQIKGREWELEDFIFQKIQICIYI
jgi:hypothetical protein